MGTAEQFHPAAYVLTPLQFETLALATARA
jgi:hypothetical protein